MQATTANTIAIVGSFILFQTDHIVAGVITMAVFGLLSLYYEEKGK